MLIPSRCAATAALLLLVAPALHAQTLVKDLGGGPPFGNPSSFPVGFFPAFGGVFFSADQPGKGSELCWTNGTPAGTVLLADIEPGYRSSSPGSFVQLPAGDLVFTADTLATGRELWVRTLSGTVQLVADLLPGPGDSYPGFMTLVGTDVLFFADDGGGQKLWKTNGTNIGTVPVASVAAGWTATGLAAVGSNVVYFTADYTLNQWEVWLSDGTPAGTRRIFAHGGGAAVFFAPAWLATLGNRVVFRATDPLFGAEPWVTDGTLAGTIPLADVWPGTVDSFPYDWASTLAVVSGGRAYFVGDTPNGQEIWSTDGTPLGTARVATAPLGQVGAVFQGLLTSGEVVFSVRPSAFTQTLYRTDGINTSLIASLGPSIQNNAYPGVLVGGVLYFPGNGGPGPQLWRTDGTTAGTFLVKDINGSLPSQLTALPNGVVFAANDGINGRELWVSDGTTAGTTMIELAPSATNATSYPQLVGTLRGRSYWLAGFNRSLWESDGTTAGT